MLNISNILGYMFWLPLILCFVTCTYLAHLMMTLSGFVFRTVLILSFFLNFFFLRGDLFFYLNNKNYTKSKWKYRRVFFINKIALDLHIKDVITEIRMTSKLDKLTNAASVRCRITFSPFLFKTAFRARDYL